VAPGKRSGSCSRSVFTYSAVGSVSRLQRDLDVPVLRADRAGVVIGEVDPAHRHTDVVDQRAELGRRNDLADRLLDPGKHSGTVLRRVCRPGGAHASGSDPNRPSEEVATQHRHQQERGHNDADKATTNRRR